MWIESMIGFGIQCNTEGLQIDKAGLYTKIQSHKTHFLSVYFFSIAPSDGQCRTTSQKISRPGLVAFGRISPKFEHLPWLALIVPPTPFHRRCRHFSSLPTSSPISQFQRERAYFHATMFPSPYTLLGWSNASQTQNSVDIDDSKHPTLPKKKKLHPRLPSGSPLTFGQYSHIDQAAPTALQRWASVESNAELLISRTRSIKVQGNMVYDAKKRIHTCATLRKLWETCQWNHEFNVSDKKNSFTELNTTIPKGSGFYSNCAHEDLEHVYDILHIHKTFLVCPVPYNYVDHDLGTTVETVTDWAASIGHALQLARSRNEELEGWFMLPAPIKNCNAENCLLVDPRLLLTPLRPFITQRFSFHDAKQWWIPGNQNVENAQYILGNALAVPYIAYRLHSQSWYAPSKHPSVTVDHSSSLRRFVYQSTNLDIEQAHALLRFDVLREIIDQRELPSGQEDTNTRKKAGLGNVRDFYKWLNNTLAPDFEGAATTSNCKYYFENGEALRAPHPNYYRYDHTMAPVLANELMSVALEHGDFLRGRFYVIEVAKMVDQHSFFVNPSRNERHRHKGEFTPTEVMNTLMGHMIGGRGRTRVMSTSIKSRDSVIVRLDLSNTPSDEGRSPLSTFASFLHTNGAMVMCTSKDGALVTFNAFGQGGKQEAHPKSPPPMVSIPPPMPSQREPNEVDVQAPNTTSLFDIQCAAGLLGPFTRFELHSRSENPPISFHSVTYEKLQSAQIATGFAMGPISFHPSQPYLQVDALLHLDPSVAEEDRPAA